MIRINLLPFRAARKKENVRQQVSIFLLLVVVLAVALAWYNTRLNRRIVSLEEQIDYTEREIIRYKKIAKEVEELKDKIALLRDKLRIIEQLDQDRDAAFTLLDTLTRVVVEKELNQGKPEKRLWFTRMEAMEERVRPPARTDARGRGRNANQNEAVAEKTEVNIRLFGVAIDNKTVADFMTRVEESGEFKDVRLVTIQQFKVKQGGGREEINLKSFEISCRRKQKEAAESESGSAVETS